MQLPKTGKRVVFAFLVALLLLAGIGVMSYRSTLRMIDDGARVINLHRVVTDLEDLMGHTAYEVATQRGFLITGDEKFMQGSARSKKEIAVLLEDLRVLFRANPRQQEQLDKLKRLLAERTHLAEAEVELRRAGNLEEVYQSVKSGGGERLLQQIIQTGEEMAEAERVTLREHQRQGRDSARMTQAAILAGGVFAFALTAAALAQILLKMSHLQQAEETFRGLLESAPDAVVIVNREGRIVWVNARTERLFGCPRGELLDQPFETLLPQPALAAGEESFVDYFAAPEGRKMKQNMELTAHRKNGKDFPAEVTMRPLESRDGLLIFSAIRDITQRKRSEQALRESEELMRFAMEADQMGLWEWNTTTGEIVRSPRHDRIFGYPSQLPKWSYELFLEHVLPEDREYVEGSVSEGVATRHGLDMKCRILRRDGEVRWVRICGRYYQGEDAKPSDRIAGVIRDITEEKQAEDFARHHEQFRAAVLDAIPAEIAVIDKQGAITAVNEPWLEFGYNNEGRDESLFGVGANYLEVIRRAAAEGDAFASESVAGIEAILAGERRDFRLEYPCDSPTEERWFLMHAVAAPPGVGGAIIAHHDISPQKKAQQALQANEELLRTMLATIPDTVQVKDGQGRWMVANEAALQHFKIKNFEWRGKTDAELATMVSSELGAGFRNCEISDHQVWSKGRPVRAPERILRTDGTSGVFDVIKVPLWHSDGRPKLLVIIGRDVTQQQRAEEALRDFNTRLEARVQDRTATLEVAMTQLRNEISERLRLEEEILQISEREQMRIGQDLHDDLGQQLVSGAMLAESVALKLQAESHPEAGKAAKLRTFITESIQTTRNLAKSFYPIELERGGLILALQNLTQRTEALADISCELKADDRFQVAKASEIHLYRIVQESISNAIKHGHASKVEIDCTVENGRCKLTVTDNGVGFTPPEKGEWKGMGLHLLSYRARLMKAEIDVRRGDLGGCQVTCVLPAPIGPGILSGASTKP
jgi:PAS domain S-box-containing protein/LPXTG-motif cell wall-anchored protein